MCWMAYVYNSEISISVTPKEGKIKSVQAYQLIAEGAGNELVHSVISPILCFRLANFATN